MFKRLLVLLAAVVSVAAQAQIFPSPPFTPAFLDGFDTLAPGPYNTFTMFGGFGAASKIGPGGQLFVDNTPGFAFSPPNWMLGQNTDVAIKVASPTKYFGGMFQAVPGSGVTAIKFAFYDQFNTFIGSVTVPAPTTWTWIGWKTFPYWSRVEIYGNGFVPGLVGMDDIQVL